MTTIRVVHNVCIRFYNNMSAKYSIRDEAGMESWLDYNKACRPGCALFINGEHVEDTGYISSDPQRLQAALDYCKLMQPFYEKMHIFTTKMMPESFGEPARVRYPDDVDVVFDNRDTLTEAFFNRRKIHVAYR